MDTPIWVMEEVVADASIPVDRDADEEERQAFRDFVSNLRPEDLIKQAHFGPDIGNDIGTDIGGS
jgi:hypothetical protein